MGEKENRRSKLHDAGKKEKEATHIHATQPGEKPKEEEKTRVVVENEKGKDRPRTLLKKGAPKRFREKNKKKGILHFLYGEPGRFENAYIVQDCKERRRKEGQREKRGGKTPLCPAGPFLGLGEK